MVAATACSPAQVLSGFPCSQAEVLSAFSYKEEREPAGDHKGHFSETTQITCATEADAKDAITLSFFDLFKVGPGPSSSHTIGPMKAANDFLKDLRSYIAKHQETESDYFFIEIHLYGSLCLTGKGHGTDLAVIGGLLGWTPPTCDPDSLVALTEDENAMYGIPPEASAATLDDVRRSQPELHQAFPLASLQVGMRSIHWHAPSTTDMFPHPNTLIFQLRKADTTIVLEAEYYSVGGGFIERKGRPKMDQQVLSAPPYPYSTMAELRKIVATHPSRSWTEILMANEVALSGKSEAEIIKALDDILNCMEASVVRGLKAEGILPGPMQLRRKAAYCYNKAKKEAYRADSFLTFLNAYSMAASEENADRRLVVTAPTSGSSGVIPGVVYYMKHHLYYPQEVVRRALMVAGCIGFLVKHNASISGAEMGCMGEIGVASAMAAAMLAHSAGADILSCEAAAEIALEHHLGITCDPIGGYVQVPCIQRNSMGAVKAYNAYLLAVASSASLQKISLDCCITTMRQTGEDMSSKYKETCQGGLALCYTEC